MKGDILMGLLNLNFDFLLRIPFVLLQK